MADLVIKGMEMPKDNNAISIIIFSNGKVSLAHDKKYAEYAEAVPLPEGHGRLGDLDRLESFLRTLALYQSGERQQGILGCCETIKATPTIVQADVTDNYVGSKSEEGETDDSKL